MKASVLAILLVPAASAFSVPFSRLLNRQVENSGNIFTCLALPPATCGPVEATTNPRDGTRTPDAAASASSEALNVPTDSDGNNVPIFSPTTASSLVVSRTASGGGSETTITSAPGSAVTATSTWSFKDTDRWSSDTVAFGPGADPSPSSFPSSSVNTSTSSTPTTGPSPSLPSNGTNGTAGNGAERNRVAAAVVVVAIIAGAGMGEL